MDEGDAYRHVSENQKINALNLVVKADNYLAQRQLLKALVLYKNSAEILPDPAIIHKIRKLRKYMKRNNMDLGEDKENRHERHNDSGKQVSPEMPINPPNNNKTLTERRNSVVGLEDLTKQKSESLGFRKPNVKSESSAIENGIKNATPKSDRETVSTVSPPAAVKGDFQSPQKPDIGHLKLKMSSSEMSPESSRNKVHGEGSLSKIVPLTKASTTPVGKKVVSPPSDEPIRCFKDLRKRMYPHQKEGMKWLARLFGEQRGGILGDDMGLGKTLQVIGYLCKMFEVNEVEHVIIVLPSALVLPWQSEIERWAPNLNFSLFHGKSRTARIKILRKLQRIGGILLTTYGLIVTNYEELSKGPDGHEFVWDYIFLDEGHKIKNPTKTQKAAHYIPARNRIIMTGTPIQNNLMELWSLFDFVHHGSLLGTIKTFKMNYENPITRARQKDASLSEKQLGYRMAQNLQKIIAPYFLRRTKAQLMSDPNSGLPKLPQKNDIIVWVKMTEDQQKVYESYLKLDEVKQLMSSSRSPLVALNILKKLCDHLRLLSMRICKALGMLTAEESRKFVNDGISHLDDKFSNVLEWTRQPGTEEPTNPVSSSKDVKETDCAATQLTGIPDSILFRESSKLMVVIELLGYMNATEHKCLVFSQSTKMLDIIQQILTNMGYRFVRMDGTITKLEERAEIIRKFETRKDIHIFLLTTQVGGVGLNLTVADRMIIVDPSWNPAIDSQAVDRIYRIGQKKNVIVFRLITCGSVEEKIYIRQLFKLSINRQTTKESKDPFRYFTKQDLKQLFIVDDLSVSETQVQLAQMHAGKRVSDEALDDQIKFLESMDTVFGISDHDLVFSTEDGDQEVQMSNSRLQTLVEKAEEAIRNEINEESRANSKKFVPGIQERRLPSQEMLNSEPAKSLSSPLFTMYADEENQDEDSGPREVHHRKLKTGHNSVPHSPDAKPQNDDVIILSDTPPDINDESNEIVMDSEDEQPSRFGESRKSNFFAFNKHRERQEMNANETVPSPEITSRNIDSPNHRNQAKSLNSSNRFFANKTLMQVVTDSPLSPAVTSGLKDVLVADSPDTYTRSVSSGSQHSKDSLSSNSCTKFTVAESDYESDESVNPQDSSLKNNPEVSEDDSTEFCSPVFRDVSVVIPSSTPRLGSLKAKDQANSPGVSTDQSSHSVSMDGGPVSPVSTDQVEMPANIKNAPASDDQVNNSEKEDGSVSTDQVHNSDMEDAPVLADEIDNPTDNTDAIPVSFGVDLLTKSLNKSLALNDSDIVRSVKRKPSRYRVLSSSENESEVEFEEPGCFSDSSKKIDEICKNDSSAAINKDTNEIHSPERNSFSLPGNRRRKTCVILSDSSDDEKDADQVSSTSLSDSFVHTRRQGIRKRNRHVLQSSSDEAGSDASIDNEDGDMKADDSVVISEELSIVVDPSEPMIQCVKTPPAKRILSHVKKTPTFSKKGSPSLSAKDFIETEADEMSKSGDKCDMTDSELDTESSSSDEEDSEDDDDDSIDGEESENEIDLPEISRGRTKFYNQCINASREAYNDANYKEALKNALYALQEDSSDIKLQAYALHLRQMTTK